MRSITNLDFHKDRNMHSFVSEVSTIQESFTKLKGGIIAMTKYIPKPVVADILTRSVTSPLLGMESKYVSILFTDIRGFTTMAEALPREVVMGMLNDWIKSFTACIHGNHGIVDKYIGDCIMALFNSEYVDRPEYWACKTALDFSEALAVLNVDLTSKSLPMLETRVGLHVGDVLVGNIGCDVRVNYTVCGSVANTASRLEQLGKVYGVTPLISGELYRVVKDTFLCVWLDTVLLRGYQEQHTHVYHLVALKSDATPQQLKVHDSFHDLRAAINSTRWEVARGLLKEFQQDKAFVPYAQVLAQLLDHVAQQHALLISSSITPCRLSTREATPSDQSEAEDDLTSPCTPSSAVQDITRAVYALERNGSQLPAVSTKPDWHESQLSAGPISQRSPVQ
eukprot:TRINITY_DN1378_c0_g1_i1.p2 TRINITY_DN1378_c0_g1~~TRINITY_DN1378_c0_g1_i1.p2  ORF type:complete len:395 (-),score=77.81 TRINITY_DN1378_c0_g1_i1:921-2105(-)